MYRTLVFLFSACAIAGCATAPRSDFVRGAAPAPTGGSSLQAASGPVTSLAPGATYVASFPEADRRAACLRLDYQEGTAAFSKCLEGDFPENPWFSRQ
ncbi:MAG: hypothetical protein KME20_27215 [Kaiparowitsia implicata GSE-PSE-MK54-09C]|nr:hypothetical protein [Kaiparowitsia implicata GSE-PSE-MK54-09C]